MTTREFAVSKWIATSTASLVVAAALGCASPPATPPSSSPVYAEPDSSIPLTPILHRSSLRRDERVLTAPPSGARLETPAPAPDAKAPVEGDATASPASASDAPK